MMANRVTSIALLALTLITATQGLSQTSTNLIFGSRSAPGSPQAARTGFTPPFTANTSSTWPATSQKHAESRWETLLDQPATFITDQPMTMEMLVKDLRKNGLPVVLTHSAEDDSASKQDLVALPLPNLPIRDRLLFGLDKLNATITLVDGFVKIISKDDVFAQEYGMVATYDVTALGVNQFVLEDHIIKSVDIETWQDNGGLGTISAIRVGDRLLLTVGSTYRVHRNVRTLLALSMKLASEGAESP